MATQRVSICKFVPRDSCNLDAIVTFLLRESDDANRFVFNEQNDSYISGCYLVQQTRNEVSYNVQENRFETVITNRLVVVKFEINLPNSILTIWGNKNIAQRLITLISQACNNQVVIDSYQVDFKKMLNRILSMGDITLSKMKLENVMIDSGINASCNVSLLNLDNAGALVKKYSDNISQISLILGDRFGDNAVSMTLFSSGSIVIYKDRDSISNEVIAQIQNIVVE